MKDLKIKKRYETFGIEASKIIDFIFVTDVKEFNLEKMYSVVNDFDDEQEDDEDITKVIHYIVRKK